MNTTMYICGHKKFPVPGDPVYKPIQLGAALHDDLGYIRDDSGDNISELNPFFSELTGMYWIWKNDHESDNTGICHYRRYFIDDAGRPLTGPDYERLLASCDVITSNFIDFGKSCRDAFIEAHNEHDLLIVEDALKKLYPEYADSYDRVFADDKNYFANLCCMSKDKFDAYCEWLFSILFEASEKIDLTGYDVYQTRAYGFYAERLLRVWIEGSGYNALPVKVGYMAEKTENVEFREAARVLIMQGRIEETMDLYNRFIKERPDVLLPASDITGNMRKIARILYLLKKEKDEGTKRLSSVSDDLEVLLSYFDRIAAAVKAKDKGSATTDMIKLIEDSKLSKEDLELIAKPIEY